MEVEEVIITCTEDSNTKPPTQKRPNKNKIPSIEDIYPDMYYFSKIRHAYRLPTNTCQQIEKNGLIQDVCGDLNCGIYATMGGLQNVDV